MNQHYSAPLSGPALLILQDRTKKNFVKFSFKNVYLRFVFGAHPCWRLTMLRLAVRSECDGLLGNVGAPHGVAPILVTIVQALLDEDTFIR